MFYLKGWLRCLKQFEPSVISLSEQDSIFRKVQSIAEDTAFSKNKVYIGKLSEAAYRFKAMSGITLFLINDTSYKLDKLNCGDNTVIILPTGTNRDELYSACTSFLQTQDEIIEKRQQLMDAYLEEDSLQGLLNAVSEIIDNPVMVIDNSFRLVCASEYEECSDLVWNESIRNGYCSYEFISQFNKLNEINDIRRGETPVLAGCLMSPMRRCIITLFADHKPVGYVLSIEADSSFDAVKTEMIEQAAKLIARELVKSAHNAGIDPYNSSWDAVVNAIEGAPKSDKILREYLRSEGLRSDSEYYVMLMTFKGDDEKSITQMPLYNVFKSVFPRSTLSYYKNDVLAIIDYDEGKDRLDEDISGKAEYISDKQIRVAVSDGFTDLAFFRRYYDQAKRVQELMIGLDIHECYCIYNKVRIYDMLLNSIDPAEMPLFLSDKERALFQYDLDNGTEYFRTLYSYIKNSRRLGDVSEELHIHKNSVSYRINRIKELFDIDLNDAETRIGFFLAYHVLALRNMKKESENDD